MSTIASISGNLPPLPSPPAPQAQKSNNGDHDNDAKESPQAALNENNRPSGVNILA